MTFSQVPMHSLVLGFHFEEFNVSQKFLPLYAHTKLLISQVGN